jgi:predicted MFS family arabinose efflux permease
LLLAGLLAGVGHGYAFPVLASQVVSRAPTSVRGSALATFTGLWSASSLVLSPTFGALADRYDDATMFAAAAMFAVAALVVWLWFEHRHGADLPD